MMQGSSFHFSEQPDGLAWDLTDSGHFTVSSAYQKLRVRNPTDRIFQWVWRSGIPLKLSILLWRILNGLLPFDDVLRRMGFQMASKCPFCSSEDSVSHAFYECSLARETWEFLGNIYGFKSRACDLRGFLYTIWNHKDPSAGIMSLLPALVCWSLWKARTSFLYGHQQTSSRSVVASSMSLLADVTRIKPPVVSGRVWDTFEGSGITLLRRYKTPMAVFWQKPNCLWKLNVDGSSMGNPAYAGGGIVVRDATGSLVLLQSLYFGHATSLFAEAMALLRGLEICKQRGLFPLHLETDSQVLH